MWTAGGFDLRVWTMLTQNSLIGVHWATPRWLGFAADGRRTAFYLRMAGGMDNEGLDPLALSQLEMDAGPMDES